MTITIEAPPEVEEKLMQAAAQGGASVADFALNLVKEGLGIKTVAERPFYETATPEEWMAALKEWADSHDSNLPAFTDEELRREHLHEDRC